MSRSNILKPRRPDCENTLSPYVRIYLDSPNPPLPSAWTSFLNGPLPSVLVTLSKTTRLCSFYRRRSTNNKCLHEGCILNFLCPLSWVQTLSGVPSTNPFILPYFYFSLLFVVAGLGQAFVTKGNSPGLFKAKPVVCTQ